MESFYNAARQSGLSMGAVRKLKEIIKDEGDLQMLTANDVRETFTQFSMAERKNVWKFISGQQKSRSPQRGPSHQSGGREEGWERGGGGGSVTQSGHGNINVGSGRFGDNAHVSHGTTNYMQPDQRNANVNVGYASGSNIAGGNITTTTYNAPRESSKYNISMNNVRGVALGDRSSVHGNTFH